MLSLYTHYTCTIVHWPERSLCIVQRLCHTLTLDLLHHRPCEKVHNLKQDYWPTKIISANFKIEVLSEPTVSYKLISYNFGGTIYYLQLFCNLKCSIRTAIVYDNNLIIISTVKKYLFINVNIIGWLNIANFTYI